MRYIKIKIPTQFRTRYNQIRQFLPADIILKFDYDFSYNYVNRVRYDLINIKDNLFDAKCVSFVTDLLEWIEFAHLQLMVAHGISIGDDNDIEEMYIAINAVEKTLFLIYPSELPRNKLIEFAVELALKSGVTTISLEQLRAICGIYFDICLKNNKNHKRQFRVDQLVDVSYETFLVYSGEKFYPNERGRKRSKMQG